MFEFILPLYTTDVRAIRIDFLGNGKSERVSRFPDELWIDQGHQIVELCKKLNCGKINLVGTSGGAYAAINAALEMPDLFHKVVADSFDGNILPEGFANAVIQERQFAKKEEQARGFYEWCQGEDWEFVVDLDTEALVNYEQNHIRLFHSSIETIQVPLLITISREDEMLANDMDTECRHLHDLNRNISYKIYETGSHPLIVSRAEEIAQLIKDFLMK
ncbi:alpha/beta hydrolase [Intestinimonas massiliensis]|uniref:Alpha/beta hydrolase n=1 Tax=Intestinimonas massiliensis (ex Afouda et al. 2020) TaxID=1673721 RepID=A0AAW5JST3_9FIRM|nr:alpha/beta hydrolase [Intestinimonas massiliensis (ex Afouda et al. 2020)]MCQ4771541.1 alpha/beta hydrolase [Intestinimonas massiliensis (ex Afouda et al. 2020)]